MNWVVRKNLKWPNVVKIFFYNITNINMKNTPKAIHIRNQKHWKQI